MAYWLDMVGSYIIGAMVLLIIVRLDLYIVSESANVTYSNIAQGNLSTAIEIVNNDFYKIGYWTSGQSIQLADSNRIKFCADLYNNGVIDTIYYYTGSTSQLSSTPNPLDKPFYRVVNDSSLSLIDVVDFNLVYYDSLGTVINYGSLSSQTHRNAIHSIKVYLKVESNSAVDSVYQGAEWEKRITPKNL